MLDRRFATGGLAAALLALVACGQREGGRSAETPRADAPARPAAAPDAGVPAPPAHPLVPAITDPALLAELEGRGFHLADLIGGGAARTNDALATASPAYRDLIDFLEEDIAASIAEENRHRPDWGAVGPTMRAKRRNLDPRWLAAANATYELVGVLNRMDRAPFAPGTCGELRLVYRMAYTAPAVSSRLPFTVNVVYRLEPGARACRELVGAWRLPPGAGADWLVREGPLVPDNLRALHAVETNFQVIRQAAGIRNQLGGTSEYILRVFHPAPGGHLVRATLENTPDVARLAGDAALRGELLALLREPASLDALDHGTILLPERFLATRASSFAPHALARMENRPFDAVFDAGDFAGLELAGRRVIRSPEALLRRLDDLSCVGCHQARTVAGFHFVGEDRAGTHPLNAVFFAGSGHFRADLARRLAYLEELERGGAPSDQRPLSFAPTAERAAYGDLCSMPGATAFDAWPCADGLTCQAIDPAVGETQLGQCFPEERRAGDPCLRAELLQNHHSLDKLVMPWTELGCAPRYSCRKPGGGFPSGMCTSNCDAIATPGEICGPTAGAGFADCLAGRTSFDTCLERHQELASRGRCNADRACRNDYVCARTSAGQDGACVPAYFLFQLRVDGHPAPR
ncbi:MAG TPA: hypothetical protein VMZ28_26320 [Kofleriaceae bacterium]|nr:hypothetical protein [Kofleriaceae bacterium]